MATESGDLSGSQAVAGTTATAIPWVPFRARSCGIATARRTCIGPTARTRSNSFCERTNNEPAKPSAAVKHPLHRYFVRAVPCEREGHELQVFAQLASPGFGAAVVEAKPINLAQAGDARREILDREQELLALEASRDKQHMAAEQLELVQQDVVRRREVGDE